ncbi:phosphorylated adapter RNA export protein [Anabrus simplex]|uniref:phosphorylated adapter RNA export protein n=1 Tax=Anabrus simplex TaxID=316456 RepID=UPI0034DD0EFF
MDKENSDDLEDGEIIDYSPLPRPMVQARSDGMRYSDNSEDDNDSNNSDSDIDSDSPCFRPKRVKMKNKVRYINHEQNSSQKKKYSVWCSDIQESELANELVNCDVRQKGLDRSRNVESYDYTLAYSLNEEGCEGEDSDEETDKGHRKRRFHERGTNFKQDSNNGELPRISVKQRLGRRQNDPNELRGHPRLIMDLRVTEENDVEDVAIDIANKLCEPKDDLILRVVQILGKEKAISLYRKCKEIEAAGGMLVLNGSRRRTPGGVFLTLIKRDSDITRENRNQIFEGDKKNGGKGKKFSINKIEDKNDKDYGKNMCTESLPSERDLPALLTHGELTVQQFAEARKGKREEVDGEKHVTNPPPSPATDGGEQIDETREITYDDDFLDLGCDTMDIF